MKIINYDPSDAAQAEIDWAYRYDSFIEELIIKTDNEKSGALWDAVIAKFGKPEPSLCDAMNESEELDDFVNEMAYEIVSKQCEEY